MARECYEEMDDDEVIPEDAFRRSDLQFRFNISRVIDKYSNLELNGKSCGIEVNLANGEVYYPPDMPSKEVRRHVGKLEAFDEQFGLAKLSAPYNGDGVFGKDFKQRRKECARLDTEFGQVFKSKYPSWRPYTTPKKSRVERTVIKKTVKELTFENSVDYFNYLERTNRIPIDAFKQQERVGFVHRLALPSTEMRACGSNMEADVGLLRSRSASPCISTERKAVPPSDCQQSMILNVDCARSRECSPSPIPLSTEATTSSNSESHSQLVLTQRASFTDASLEETDRVRDQSNQELDMDTENSTPLVTTVKSFLPMSSSEILSPATSSNISAGEHPCRRKATPSRFLTEAEADSKDANDGISRLKNISHTAAKESRPFIDSINRIPNQETFESSRSDQNREKSTPATSKKSTACTPSSTKASTISTARYSRKRKASHSSADGRSKQQRNEEEKPQHSLESTPLCSRMSNNLSLVKNNQESAARSSKKKRTPSQTTPKTTSSGSSKRSSGRKKVSPPSAVKMFTEDNPRSATVSSASKEKKKGNFLAKVNTGSPVQSSCSSSPTKGPNSGKRCNSSSAKKTPKLETPRSSTASSTSRAKKKGNVLAKVNAEIPVEASSIINKPTTGKHSNSSSAKKSPVEETPRSTAGFTSALRAKKKGKVLAECITKSTAGSSSGDNHVNGASSGKRRNSSSTKKCSPACEGDMHLKEPQKSAERPENSERKLRPRIARKSSESLEQASKPASKTAKSETKQVKQATPKLKLNTPSNDVNKEILDVSSSINQKKGNKTSELPKKKSKGQKKGDECALQTSPSLISPNSPLPSPSDNSRGNMKSDSRPKRRSDDSNVERVVTPINDDKIAYSLWNENVSSVVRSYDDCNVNGGKMGTILGFDVGEVRQQCDDSQRSTLSAFVNCARKYQSSGLESSSVDIGLKEDRRALASARVRNRQLNSGYYV